MMNSYSLLLHRYRWAIFLISIGLIIGLATGVKNLTFSADYRVFFDSDNEQLQDFNRLQGTYTNTDNLLFVIAPKSGNVFDKKTLEAVAELTDAAWQLPFSQRVDSITNFQHTETLDDDLIVSSFGEALDKATAATISAFQDRSLSEPLLVNRLIAPDSQVTGINVQVNRPRKSTSETPDLVEQARNLADQIENKYPELSVYLTGAVMLDYSFTEAAVDDILTLIPIMFVIVIIMMSYMLRYAAGTAATLTIISLSSAFVFGVVGWFGWQLNPISPVAPTIIFTIAVADCVHIITSYRQSLNRGVEQVNAVTEALAVNFKPVFLTTATTTIGFLTMNFSEVPPLQDLGNMVAMGVVCAFVLSVVFLPVCLYLFPKGKSKQQKVTSGNFSVKLGEFVIRNHRTLLIATLVVSVGLITLAPNNRINDEFVEYFSEDSSFKQDTDFTSDNLTGIYQLSYSLEAGDYDVITHPEFLAKLDEFTIWLRQNNDIVHVNSISDTFKRLNMNMHNNDRDWYRLPENRELASQYLLLYEMILPFGLDTNDRLNQDKTSTLVTIALKNVPSYKLLELKGEIDTWLAENTSGISFYGASPSLMFSHIGKKNIESMVVGTLVAILLISTVIGVALKSAKIGLISLVPNLVPVAAAFGIWAVLRGEVGMALSTVTALSLGIVVDDTVHFLCKFLDAREKHNLSLNDAITTAFKNVGPALITTSLVLVVGFATLAFSEFTLNKDMGLLTSITIMLALVFDLLFLPPFLIVLSSMKLFSADKPMAATTETAAEATQVLATEQSLPKS